MHLDITPESIMSREGVWKLANFEKARVVNGVPLNGNGAVSGNVKYISPEQVKGSALDRRSDIYSMGVVLYEMLCGHPPFDSTSQFEVMLAHVSQHPAPPSQLMPGLPESLDEVVLKSLSKDPAARLEAGALAAALADIEEAAGLAAGGRSEEPEAAIVPENAAVPAGGVAASAVEVQCR